MPKQASDVAGNEVPSKADPLRQWWGWLPPLLLLTTAIGFGHLLLPWEYMWALAFGIFFSVKWLTWLRARHAVAHSAGRSLAYLFLWPGMDARSFLSDVRPVKPGLRSWCWAFLKTLLGAVLLWVCARHVPAALPLVRGWVGLLGPVLLLHFGSFEIVALGWQALGVRAEPIMQAPAFSRSLSEFWGKRWNLGFRQLSYEFVFRPLHSRMGVRAATLLVFLVSGLIHESVISVPARGGYGLPTGYFILQGLGVLIERSPAGRALGLGGGTRGWVFMAVTTAAPAFWLFHPPFVLRVMLPFMEAIRAL